MRARVVLLVLLVGCLGVQTASSALGDVRGSDPPSSRDAKSATAAAESPGDPSVVDQTMNSTTWANPDGTMTTDISAAPMHVPDASEPDGWADVDTQLRLEAGSYVPVAVAADMSFSNGGAGEMASVGTLTGTHSYTLEWPGTLPAPTIDGNTATYHDVWPHVDLVLEARPTGFSQRFVVHERPAEPLVLRFPLSLKGMKASVDDTGALTLTSKTGEPLGSAEPAMMWGAAMGDHSNEPLKQQSVDLAIVKAADGSPVLQEEPDMSFLQDPTVEYPVTIDPSPDLSVQADTYVASDFATTSYGSDTILKSGTYNGGSSKNRSYIRFTGLTALDGQRGAVVSQAILKLYENWSYSCTDSTVQVWALDGTFAETTNWNGQPAQTTKYASLDVAKGYSASCPDGTIWLSTGGSSGLTLADIVQKWVSGTTSNWGFRVRAGDGARGTSNGRQRSSGRLACRDHRRSDHGVRMV